MALQLHRKETEWMAEYDGSVKALLGIIKYHEDEKKQLKMEVKRLKAAAAVVPPSITRMARSTQTETLGSMKAAMRRNNVRFAKDEDDVATNKVERLSADAKTKASIARMQQLFEQIQDCRYQHHSKCANRQDLVVKYGVDSGQIHVDNEHYFSDHLYKFKTAVLERLGNPRQRIAQRDYRVHVLYVQFLKTKILLKRRQSRCHRKHLKKDLEECNRVLLKRLAIQQKVLNQLLHTKLKAASSNTEQYKPNAFLLARYSHWQRTDRSTIRKFEGLLSKEIPVTNSDQKDDMGIESAEMTERRPLSPPAA